jgi:hypothetical protein
MSRGRAYFGPERLLVRLGLWRATKATKNEQMPPIRSRGKKNEKSQRVDRNLVAFCGLYCGDCPAYTRAIADRARELRAVLRQTRFDTFARKIPTEQFQHYVECYECLVAMTKMRCRQICRDRSSRTKCKIRKCCLKRGYEGCWECAEFEDCENLAWLTTVHKDAHIKNMRIIAKEGIAALVEGRRSW